ncbi:hypothetical protein AGR1B_pa0289 [Agrobacterium fabacearum S56]|nr:hypothetical protein AGR1B_pa0289 [Agrobacterium fabacearum S56]
MHELSNTCMSTPVDAIDRKYWASRCSIEGSSGNASYDECMLSIAAVCELLAAKRNSDCA